MLRTHKDNVIQIPAIMCGLLATLAGLTACATPRLLTPEGEWIEGEPIPLIIEDAPPGSLVTVTAERQPIWFDEPVRSRAVFRVDDDGRVDISESAPVAAPWRGVDPAGLFWSMRSVEEDIPELTSRDHTRIRVDLNGDGAADLEREFLLRRGPSSLRERTLPGAFPGAFLLTPATLGDGGSEQRAPVVIILGGSEGNDIGARYAAPMFAARGYAALGLPYVSGAALGGEHTIPGLPLDFRNIPLELIERVIDWIRTQPDLDDQRIALYGVSKGAEFVLSAACRIDGVSAVAAIVPSDLVWPAFGPGVDERTDSCFSWRGEPLPFITHPIPSPEKQDQFFEGSDHRWRIASQAARLAHADSLDAARIPVERIEAPVFVAGGDSDWLWDSGGMARNIQQRRDAAGRETTLIVGADAGHYISLSPYHPHGHHSARTAAEAHEAMWRFFETALSPAE